MPQPEQQSSMAERPWFLRGEYFGLLGALLVLILFFGLQSEYFWSPLTFTTLANQIPSLTVIAVGMTFVLIIAGIDLSVGSVMALSGAVLGLAIMDMNAPLWLACILCLATGLACGAFNGLVVTRWSVPSFIVTLGMLEIARGGAYLVTDSQTKYIGIAVESVSAPLPGINLSPALFLAVTVVILGQLLLSRTIFGRRMIAVGTNEEAVHLSGINVAKVKLMVFSIAGLLAGLGGVPAVCGSERGHRSRAIRHRSGCRRRYKPVRRQRLCRQHLARRVDHRGAANRPRQRLCRQHATRRVDHRGAANRPGPGRRIRTDETRDHRPRHHRRRHS
jgi:ribose/xylose/arabinose/galactoside ABC-type transport system permease subunit